MNFFSLFCPLWIHLLFLRMFFLSQKQSVLHMLKWAVVMLEISFWSPIYHSEGVIIIVVVTIITITIIIINILKFLVTVGWMLKYGIWYWTMALLWAIYVSIMGKTNSGDKATYGSGKWDLRAIIVATFKSKPVLLVIMTSKYILEQLWLL